MTLSIGLAIFFTMWWTVLFVTLPFGVRSQHEGGENYVVGRGSRRADRAAARHEGALDDGHHRRSVCDPVVVHALEHG